MPKFNDEPNWITEANRAVENAIRQSSDHLHRLVIVLGVSTPPRSIFLKRLKMKINGAAYVNLGLEASKVLKDVPSYARRDEVEGIIGTITDQAEGDVLLLDGLGVLLDPDLEFDPIRFLRDLSRSRIVVASIGGEYVNGVLTYSEQGHSEYRRLDVGDAVIVDLGRFDH